MSPHAPIPKGRTKPRQGPPGNAKSALWLLLVSLLLAGLGLLRRPSPADSVPDGTGPAPLPRVTSGRPIATGQFHGVGTVYRLLPDDTTGIPHQKFLVRTPDGRSLLIVHNTRIAPRIDGLATGDRVEFCGDFEPNDKGGLVHWTHRDPGGRHPGGWLLHAGRYYE